MQCCGSSVLRCFSQIIVLQCCGHAVLQSNEKRLGLKGNDKCQMDYWKNGMMEYWNIGMVESTLKT